jgi:hypothetical protein
MPSCNSKASSYENSLYHYCTLGIMGVITLLGKSYDREVR